MAEPTEADRTKALQALGYPRDRASTFATVEYMRVQAIAQALADQRERAQAPFEGIADEIHEFADRRWDSTEQALDYFEDRIRRAAEETGQ